MSTRSNPCVTTARTGRRIVAPLMTAVLASSVFAGAASAAKKPSRKPARTVATVSKPKIPLPGSPCTNRAQNFPGTALDCVDVPGKGLQWRVRGTIRNPFRIGEAVEVYSLESSKFRVELTDWDSDVTEESKAQGVDPTVPGIAFLVWRSRSTLLSSGTARAADRANEANPPFAYIVGPNTREDGSRSLLARIAFFHAEKRNFAIEAFAHVIHMVVVGVENGITTRPYTFHHNRFYPGQIFERHNVLKTKVIWGNVGHDSNVTFRKTETRPDNSTTCSFEYSKFYGWIFEYKLGAFRAGTIALLHHNILNVNTIGGGETHPVSHAFYNMGHESGGGCFTISSCDGNDRNAS